MTTTVRSNDRVTCLGSTVVSDHGARSFDVSEDVGHQTFTFITVVGTDYCNS